VNSGWELVGNYGDMGVSTTTDVGGTYATNFGEYANKINTGVAGSTTTPGGVLTGSGGTGIAGAGGKGSSWWLVSAYNTGFVQSAGAENRSTLDNGNDYFKLFAVAGSACTAGGNCGPKRVPEPGSFALAGLALLGLTFSRRKILRKS